MEDPRAGKSEAVKYHHHSTQIARLTVHIQDIAFTIPELQSLDRVMGAADESAQRRAGYARTGAGAGGDQTVERELVIDIEYSSAGDAELPGKDARGRKLFAGAQAAVADGLPERIVELYPHMRPSGSSNSRTLVGC